MSDRYDSSGIKEVLLYSLIFFLNGFNYYCSLCQRIKITQCAVLYNWCSTVNSHNHTFTCYWTNHTCNWENTVQCINLTESIITVLTIQTRFLLCCAIFQQSLSGLQWGNWGVGNKQKSLQTFKDWRWGSIFQLELNISEKIQ